MSAANTEPKKCAQCKQIISGGVLTAMEQTWHPEHFCCGECNEQITSPSFNVKDDKPICDNCFTKNHAKKCNGCNELITDGKIVQAMNAHWHEDHFVCQECKSKLIGTKFVEKRGLPYCQKCYTEKHADKCNACKKPIADKAVVAMDAKYHQFCFKCSRCEKPIMKDQSFQVEGGKPHCVKCP